MALPSGLVGPSPAPGPLTGIRVVDCSTVLAGPYATMILADLGADVIKVEPPDGDATRGWGPPWVGDAAASTRTAAYFLSVNRNKRSIRIDLKTPDGVAILRRLLERGDVFVENFRPQSLDRLGLSDEALRLLQPSLVHLAISGYGRRGPAASRPGYDFIVQAVGGLMSITGDADEDGGHPTKVGVAISDVVTGLYAAIGILAALLARPHAGGQRVDATLLGSTLAALVNQAQNAFVSGVAPGRRGNAHPNIVPYETFATADGEIAVAVGSERQWARLCAAIELPGLADDQRFATNGDRVERRSELRPLLADRFAGRSTAAWLADLDAAEIPAGAVADIAAAFESEAATALGMQVNVEHPAWGVVRQVGLALDLSVTPGSIRTPPPLLGEHTDAVLAEADYSAAEVLGLRERGIV